MKAEAQLMHPTRSVPRATFAVIALVLAACGAAASPSPSTPASLTPSPTAISSANPNSLLPDGIWQVELSKSDLLTAGASPEAVDGVYRWTFDGSHARIEVSLSTGDVQCDADASSDGDVVVLTYLPGSICEGEVDRLRWTVDPAGLNFTLLKTNAGFKDNRAYLEAKPWQLVDGDPSLAFPSAVPAGTGKSLNVGCSPDAPCKLSAGTWTLTGQFSFIVGMQVTVPDGWQSTEQDAGEFNLWPNDHPNDHLFMVKDIAAVRSDGSMKQVEGVPQTEEGLISFWRQDPNLVVSKSTSTTIGDGIDATAYVITVSRDAKFKDPGCPAYPRCADFFTDPAHWDGGVYGIGAPAAVRLYFAAIGSGADEHLLVIGLEGENPAALERLTKDATPIIDSIRLPSTMAE
jgi:hypothetical protein